MNLNNKMNEIGILDTNDYWQGLYVNGKLEYETHKIDIDMIERFCPISKILYDYIKLNEDEELPQIYNFNEKMWNQRRIKNAIITRRKRNGYYNKW